MTTKENFSPVESDEPAELRVSLLDVVLALSSAVDSVSPALSHHHGQVAMLADYLAAELGLPLEQRDCLIWAALVHDVGAFSLRQRLSLLEFDGMERDGDHSEMGFRLVGVFKPFAGAATLIRYHHTPWRHGRGQEIKGAEVPLGSHILHLADRIAVMTGRHEDVLARVGTVLKKVNERTGDLFHPDLVEAFRSIAAKEVFWFDVTSPQIMSLITSRRPATKIDLSLAGLTGLAEMFCQVIDFRSRFTSTHSHGVAASAETLAHVCGLGSSECRMMRIAGYLHDLGKLVVPASILEKPTSLTAEEWVIIKRHPYVTWRVLGLVPELESINRWGSCHHERLDGRGYPFHYKGHELSWECRIMAVADVFTALTEKRPYRDGVSPDSSITILKGMADSSSLDWDVFRLLRQNRDEINFARAAAQQQASRDYERFRSPIPTRAFSA